MNTQSCETFNLRLTGEQHWHIIGEGNQKSLVRHLAHLLRLRTAAEFNGEMKLIFMDGDRRQINHSGIGEPVFVDRRERVCVWWHPDHHEGRVEILNLYDEIDRYFAMRMGLQMVRHLNIVRGGLSLHAAFAELKGSGILLAAPSGTGKTTCCQRFPEHWKVLSDDEVLVVKSDIGEYTAHPLPTWSHYIHGEGYLTWQTESSTRIQAIFFLEQAERDEIVPISQSEGGLRLHAAIRGMDRVFWKALNKTGHRRLNTMLFHNACDISGCVPAYILRLSLHGRFWKNIETVLSKAYEYRTISKKSVNL